MKFFIAAFAVTFGMTAFANNVDANLFNCNGENNTLVTFTSTSITGKPTFQIKFRGSEPRVNALANLKTQQTFIGKLVTVVDNHMVPLDGPSILYSLVVPKVTLEQGSTAKVSTFAIKTSISNPFFHSMATNIVENSDIVPVECTAESVIF